MDAEHGKSAPARVNPAALAGAEAARLLAKASSEPVTEAMIRGDIDDGAPTNPDGTVNLVHYAAWLAMKTREDAGG